jgi:C-terminal processing protease CtpA/Prc
MRLFSLHLPPVQKLFLSLILLSLTGRLTGQLPNTLSAGEKIYGLSKFWQEVNYNFVYLDKFGKQRWDSTYREFIPRVLNTGNDYEYFRELQRFCALLGDGHTNVYLPGKPEYEQMTTMFGEYRLFVENIGGKAVIVRTNLSKKQEIPTGTEIIEVNGLPTGEYIRLHVAPYISSSTGYVLQDWSIARLLRGFAGETYDLVLKKPGGGISRLKLTHAFTAEKEVFPGFETGGGLLEFKWLDKQVAYLALNSFSDPRIDSLFRQVLPDIYKAKALVIDLRYNGGGSTVIGTDILRYFTSDQLLYGSRSMSRSHIPTYKAWGSAFTAKDTATGRPDWGMSKEEVQRSYLSSLDQYYHHFEYAPDTIHLEARRHVVPTALLTGHSTASAAEDFLIYADRLPHMVRIGESTFGSTGQPYSFGLPGGASARVCTKKDTYPDGREFVGYGIRPQVEVIPDLEDYLRKRDPVLLKAHEYLKTKIR